MLASLMHQARPDAAADSHTALELAGDKTYTTTSHHWNTTAPQQGQLGRRQLYVAHATLPSVSPNIRDCAFHTSSLCAAFLFHVRVRHSPNSKTHRNSNLQAHQPMLTTGTRDTTPLSAIYCCLRQGPSNTSAVQVLCHTT